MLKAFWHIWIGLIDFRSRKWFLCDNFIRDTFSVSQLKRFQRSKDSHVSKSPKHARNLNRVLFLKRNNSGGVESAHFLHFVGSAAQDTPFFKDFRHFQPRYSYKPYSYKKKECNVNKLFSNHRIHVFSWRDIAKDILLTVWFLESHSHKTIWYIM